MTSDDDAQNKRPSGASIAERLYDGTAAECEIEDQLADAGVQFEKIGWDHYDWSLEIFDVPPDHRLSEEAQRFAHSAGFAKVYVNHTDGWETHYSLPRPGKEFAPIKGWRVSYPHKRGPQENGIWVEEVCPTWPEEWFKTGYAIVKTGGKSA